MAKMKVFENGLTLITDTMENYESVAFNLFVKTGSVNETEGNYGISHFIEHMLFKGTETRTAAEIASIMDAIGANVNAYTDKTETTFFSRSTADNLETCVDIFSDMLFHSTFDKKEMAREKKVVLEEIKMYDDDPHAKSELMADALLYAGTPFGKDVAGTRLSVKQLTQQKIKTYMSKFYVPANIILSFAGNITEQRALDLVDRYFLKNFPKKSTGSDFQRYEQKAAVKIVKAKKENEQSQLHISFPGLYLTDSKRFALKILSVVMGMGMSSRLFQRIREKLGLVYSIYCEENTDYAGGDISVHFATSTVNVPLALSAVSDELKKARNDGFTGEEFQNAKNNLISNIKLEYENTAYASLMNAKSLANTKTILSKKDLIELYQKVTLEDVNKLAATLFRPNAYAISYVGSDLSIQPKKYFKL